ncbi:MAG: site-specific DNA-methyltransferase [Tannerella sp.]|nr:site-specific DNA-methyltransferase [Tannerella sp.]
MVNKLILGDNLEVLKKMENETVDLIYLDPPFFSNRNYEVIWGDEGEVRSFQDRWAGGMEHYIAWLKERVAEMHRILKPAGSIFLHCDWHADAYIRVQILDKIFGASNFLNEITWKRTTTHNDSKQGAKQFGIVQDKIFFYAKDLKLFTFYPQFERYTSDYIAASYNKFDPDGRRFKASDLSAAKPGGNTSYEWKGWKPPTGRYWAYSKANMEEFESEGRIYYSDNGKPYLKHYLDEMPGNSVDDLWNNCVFRNKDERIGYPTQKPAALLERILKCSTKEGDLVLDPFAGGGTTIAVADKLNRKWTGIDQSVQAIKVTELRLDKQRDLFSVPFTVQLHKYDYNTLRYKDAFEFESWIVGQFGGTGNAKQRSDLGLDGRMPDGAPIQVKRSDNIGRNVIDNFFAAIQRYDEKLFEKNVVNGKPVGYIIAFSFGKGCVEEVSRLKNHKNIIIELVRVDSIVPIAKKPAVTVEINELARDAKGVREIEFIAAGQSEAGIEFYSWDFEYSAEKGFKAGVMLDKEGKQTSKLKAGLHNIAVKVVDNDGLESIEVIKLKVNGTVERTE